MLEDTYYIRPHYQDTESKQPYLAHRNKHREVSKLGDKETDPNERQNKTQEKELNKMETSYHQMQKSKQWL